MPPGLRRGRGGRADMGCFSRGEHRCGRLLALAEITKKGRALYFGPAWEKCRDRKNAKPRSGPFEIGLPDTLESQPLVGQQGLQARDIPVNGLAVQVLVDPPESPQIKIHVP